MGWGRTFLLGDIGNRLDIADVEQDVERLRDVLRSQRRRDNEQDDRIAVLERRNEELTLYLGSLVRLLVGNGLVAQEEVAAFVDAIDGPDPS